MPKQFLKKDHSIYKRLTDVLPAALILVFAVFILTGCVNGGDEPKPVLPTLYPDSAMSQAAEQSEGESVNKDTEAQNANENTEDGKMLSVTPTLTPTPLPKVGLYINEILATNDKYKDGNGRYTDMIELYNGSENTIDLSKYYLSDSKKHFSDYRLPQLELAPGEYCILSCTGKYEKKYDTDMAFKLSYFGEKVYIFDGEGNIVDRTEYPELPKNISYGRSGAEEYAVFDAPTLGNENGKGFMGIAPAPTVDVAPGFYEGTQLISFVGGGAIRYTTDGSEPDRDSKLWDGKPIVVSHTMALRAYTRAEGYLDSFDTTFNYFIGEPEYELDVLMLSMSEDDFDTMSDNYTSGKKFRANISMYSNGRQQFDTDCAVSIFGCTSREYDKKSYKLKFSSDYGPSKLRYRLFGNSDIDEFNSIVLRSGSQDNDGPMLRDEYIAELSVLDGEMTEVLVMNYRPVNLYINGEYRGIYYIREHEDADMIASHYDCDPEQVTLLEQGSEVKCGSDAAEWKEMWSYLKEHHLDNPEAYDYVKSLVSLESVADYYIIQMWTGNIDMDNVREFKAGDGKWRYALFDMDLSLVRPEEGSVSNAIGRFNSGLYTFNALIYRLLENEEFRELFCERLALHARGVYSDETALGYLGEMESLLEHDMQYNCERWGGVKDSSGKVSYRTYKGWKESVASLRALVKGRAAKLVEDFVRTKNIDSEMARRYFTGIISE